MSLFRAIATVGGLTMISRVAGFVRDLLIARYLGAGPIADAFFVSLRLPNFFRSLFAEGAFTAGFLPLFSRTEAKEGRAAAQHFAERALSILLFATLGFTLVAQVAMPLVILVLAPGFVGDPLRFPLSVTLTIITFPYLLFVSLASLYGAVLNCFGRFFGMAATPILLNLVMIAGMLWLTPYTPNAGYALAWSTLIGGILQFLWLAWDARRAGLDLRLRRPIINQKVRRLFRLVLPAALGAGATQVNLVVGLILASLLPAGAVSYLFYADRINQLTVGVVGTAIATALLPTLSSQLARDNHAVARYTQNRAMEFGLLLALPSCAALLVIPFPIISILFQRGEFDLATARETANTLFAYAFGLPGFVLSRTLTPSFHARQDTRTPVKLAMVSIVVNIGLGLALLPVLAHAGLALATAMAANVNTLLLLITLYRRGLWEADDRLKRRSLLILLAAAAMALVLFLLDRLALTDWYAGDFWYRSAALIVLVGSGLAVYLACVMLFGATRPSEWKAILRRE
ncbi:MAG: murein biosynthesis integral membrane protein MurJ [Ferrovibrio sp.]|uniref:murein biosynthesis integral membrane protein MurJ n=1 Tax=Ferrovibrio sp. TaxID=1917215 RepID=UPI0026021847|nr:murein biosynthesis integral membrane protein MurJ [Ferrovibrio sp.]MCW0235540.1 murein biosynthesis integral membrane protein MurJ [Ferrovibrio sp.]